MAHWQHGQAGEVVVEGSQERGLEGEGCLQVASAPPTKDRVDQIEV